MILTRLITISLLMSSFASGNHQVTRTAPTSVPDFSGTWKLDHNLSTAKWKDFDLILVISQNPPVLNVKRIIKKKHKESISDETYYTDGRGERISFLFGGRNI